MTSTSAPGSRRRRCVAATVTLLALTATACSGSDDGSAQTTAPAPVSSEAVDTTVSESSPDPTTAATPSTDDTVAPAATAIIEVSVSPGVTPGLEGALKDVTERSCTESEGGWTTTGVLANPGTAAYDYRVYTAFMSSTDEMLALVQSDMSGVAPGAEATWEAVAAIGDVQDVSCVLRVEKNPVAAPATAAP